MPNRIIKESICTSDTIDNLEAAANAETFFYRLLVSCDDYGRMDARPAILRAKTYPLRVDKLKLSEIENWLKKLSEVGLIVIYDNNGRNYLQMPTWENHQQVRANKSKFPGINDEGSILISNDIVCNQEKTITNIAGDINCYQLQANVPVIDIRNRYTIDDNRNIIVGEKNPPTPPKPKKYKFDQYHMKLAQYLLDCIRKNKSDFKEPSLNDWADTIRLMIERDNRKYGTIHDVIEWCQLDSFWKSNILSTDKLRKQFDMLEMQMNEKGNRQQPPKESNLSRLKRIARGEQVE